MLRQYNNYYYAKTGRGPLSNMGQLMIEIGPPNYALKHGPVFTESLIRL